MYCHSLLKPLSFRTLSFLLRCVEGIETVFFRIAAIEFLWFNNSHTKIPNGICFLYHPIQSGPKKCIHSLLINIFGINLNEISISGWECNVMFSQQMAQDISASQERLCHLLSKNYKSACAICWENITLHSYPEIEISFKFIPKILMSKECIHFFGPLCISGDGSMTKFQILVVFVPLVN